MGSRRRSFGALCIGAVLLLGVARAAAEPPALPAEGTEVFGVDTGLGRVAYNAGRGLRVGRTGLTLGGFATTEVEWLEDDESSGGADANLFVFFDPTSFLHFFSEIEAGNLAQVDSGRSGIRTDPEITVERLYLDLGRDDWLNLRVGKFLTPIGRWNLVHAEPLVWTTSEPVIVEDVFDEFMSGAMLWGTLFPRTAALSYSLYGTFLEPINPDPDFPPAKRSVGAHLEWASLRGWSVGASYWASKNPNEDWHTLGGLDGLWLPHPRVELTGEAVFGEGSFRNGMLWGLYAQAAVETVRTVYLVGRYEHFSPPGTGRDVDLFDLGIAWVPRPYLRIKADYRIVDHRTERAPPGLFASFSILF